MLDDFDLIVSSFQSQYGLRLSRELPAGMKWAEFASLLSGLGPDTALGRIVAVRMEEDKDILKNFTLDQHRIRNEWRCRRAKQIAATADKTQVKAQIDAIKMGFLSMEGLGPR
ncbi:hypothetical protein HQK08_07685 [Blautia massiliensis]|uniref:Gp15 family bacteriophage protein n=1 Tax=Blautia massiliensis (ex Durand et al. 2017) TaxID=1737424 RepID=UPI00156E3928|nr:Gp15 family bacteriophage protein [Blautia massiliensis (ex Durand et al. 2017)]NSK79795.1 hypothetical protein [Blautia massiliensis (ex Durand et al. 2017)]